MEEAGKITNGPTPTDEIADAVAFAHEKLWAYDMTMGSVSFPDEPQSTPLTRANECIRALRRLAGMVAKALDSGALDPQPAREVLYLGRGLAIPKRHPTKEHPETIFDPGFYDLIEHPELRKWYEERIAAFKADHERQMRVGAGLPAPPPGIGGASSPAQRVAGVTAQGPDLAAEQEGRRQCPLCHQNTGTIGGSLFDRQDRSWFCGTCGTRWSQEAERKRHHATEAEPSDPESALLHEALSALEALREAREGREGKK